MEPKTKNKKVVKPRRNHRTALQKTPEQVQKLETDQISKFMKGVKEFDFKHKESETAFELLCSNTLGYVQPLARKLILTLIQPSK
jgi:hypothetical protein